MRKKYALVTGLLAVVLCAFMLISGQNENVEKWTLVWEEGFENGALDTTIWSRIPRGKSDWNDQMSLNDACFEMRDGNLILKGIVTPEGENDTLGYITGGVYTKGKKAFHNGRLEIKAKLQAARGAWPAIWLMPFDTINNTWPNGGEIDIMERLNHDDFAYQTVHSHYITTLGIKDNPPHYSTGKINPDDFNVYAVEMYPDSLVFFINDNRTFSYPRIKTDKEGQYPFDKPFYLLIDNQLGGKWVGEVAIEDLPVEMEIDWVRYYQKQ